MSLFCSNQFFFNVQVLNIAWKKKQKHGDIEIKCEKKKRVEIF